MNDENGGDLAERLRMMKDQIEETMRLFPMAVAEVSEKNADAGLLLAEISHDMESQKQTVLAALADYPAQLESMIAEANQCVADVQMLLETPPPVNSPPIVAKGSNEATLDPAAFELAAQLGRELIHRFAPADVSPSRSADGGRDDSRVWFELSQFGRSGALGELLAEIETLLTSVPSRVVAWWACVALSQVVLSDRRMLSAEDETAIEQSVAWVLSPTDEASANLAKRMTHSPTPSINDALAAFFGAIAAAEPRKAIAAHAVCVFSVGLAAWDESAKMKAARRALKIAEGMRQGRRLWPTVADKSVNVRESLATFSRWMAE